MFVYLLVKYTTLSRKMNNVMDNQTYVRNIVQFKLRVV